MIVINVYCIIVHLLYHDRDQKQGDFFDRKYRCNSRVAKEKRSSKQTMRHNQRRKPNAGDDVYKNP